MKKSRPFYLLILLFLFLQGSHFAFAKSKASSNGQPCAQTIRLDKLQTIDKDQQKESAYDYTLFSEREDDDDNLSDRKKMSISRFQESSAGISLLAALSECSFSRQSANRSFYLTDYKYIFQRTLRV
jgi:hypothetical protein